MANTVKLPRNGAIRWSEWLDVILAIPLPDAHRQRVDGNRRNQAGQEDSADADHDCQPPAIRLATPSRRCVALPKDSHGASLSANVLRASHLDDAQDMNILLTLDDRRSWSTRDFRDSLIVTSNEKEISHGSVPWQTLSSRLRMALLAESSLIGV